MRHRRSRQQTARSGSCEHRTRRGLASSLPLKVSKRLPTCDLVMGYELASSHVHPMLEVHESWHLGWSKERTLWQMKLRNRANSSPAGCYTATQDIDKDRWSAIWVKFTRENR